MTRPPWALRGARVFDGHRLHRDSPVVVIEEHRVVTLDTSASRSSDDLQVVDLGDVTLLPGLIDAHVHLAFDASVYHKVADEDASTTLARMRSNAARQLRAGVTTVRDLGDRDYLALALRDEYAADPTAGPHVVASGPPITRKGGHCSFLGGEADGIAAVEAAVRERIERGVDVIKVMATGGATTSSAWALHESQYQFEELAAATEVAHESGKRITAHAHGPRGIADAVAAGTDGIEHVSFFTEDGIDVDWRAVGDMARAGTFVGATDARLPEAALLTPQLRDRLGQRSANFVRMHREGVRLVCCSDAGVGPGKPHGVLPRGIIHFSSIGLTNAEALASATTVAAEACGVADRKGRIAPGYDADIIAVAGDPLEDLNVLLDVRAVIRSGRAVTPL
ncbi:MAG TPA: amidohydrolase family protein [Acidimicrobiia bacterium]|nr:amidohydrolase family protein [Acidimicrobiia bacterium]